MMDAGELLIHKRVVVLMAAQATPVATVNGGNGSMLGGTAVGGGSHGGIFEQQLIRVCIIGLRERVCHGSEWSGHGVKLRKGATVVCGIGDSVGNVRESWVLEMEEEHEMCKGESKGEIGAVDEAEKIPEVEDHNPSSSFYPFIVVEKEVFHELRMLETILDSENMDQDWGTELGKLEAIHQAQDFINELGWLQGTCLEGDVLSRSLLEELKF